MRAHVIDAGMVVNTIEVESLEFMPNLVDGENGGSMGWLWDGSRLTPPLAPQKTVDEMQADARSERNRLLSQSDWTQVLDAPVDRDAWSTYRQALRDLPQQDGFPVTIVWPVKP